MPLQLPSSDPRPLAPGLYSTDAFHRCPLFAIDGQVVRSWEESYALHGPARLEDINPAYVAALISGNHYAEESPYRRIRRLPRANFVHVGDKGLLNNCAYDPFAGGAGPLSPEALYSFLSQGLLDHISQELKGNDQVLGCEHSSGLDSNAVLGALRHGLGVTADRIHTYSNENDGERHLLKIFRPFHGLLPEQCISSNLFQDEIKTEQSNLYEQQLRILGAPAQIGAPELPLKLLQQRGCSVLFSGFGGDQAISHNAANVPSDLVALGRWRALIQWMDGSRRQALKTGAGRILALNWRSWAERKVIGKTKSFYRGDLLVEALTERGHNFLDNYLQEQYPWEIDGYIRQHQSIRQRVLADWISVRVEEEKRLAEAYGMIKVFPLLDERSIATLLNQEPTLFGEGVGRGRLLHRRAFSSFLPPILRENPSKDREQEGGVEQWRNNLAQGLYREYTALLSRQKAWHPWVENIFNTDTVKRKLYEVADANTLNIHDIMAASRSLKIMSKLHIWAISMDV